MTRCLTGLICCTALLLAGCVSTTPQSTLDDTASCSAMVLGGFRKVADERSERFNGKVGEPVARCRGGDKAAAFRPSPFVDWSNYWATGDAASLLPGTTGVGGHLGPNGRGVDGALLDLEYQRMELIKFNLFDNSGSFADYALGRDGVAGTALKTWPSMRLPAGSPFYAAVGGDGPQLCQGELIRWRQLNGICNDIRNPKMGSTGALFARNVQFEATYPTSATTRSPATATATASRCCSPTRSSSAANSSPAPRATRPGAAKARACQGRPRTPTATTRRHRSSTCWRHSGSSS